MARKGSVLIFGDGQRCMVVDNKLNKARWTAEGSYEQFDDSRIILVNIDTGKVELHYRYSIPYEEGMPYIPIWGGVVEIKDSI